MLLKQLRKGLVLITMGLALWMGAVAANAAAPPATQMLQTVTQQMLQALKANNAAIQHDLNQLVKIVNEIIVPHVDLDEMSKRVLAKYWRTATPEQRVAFDEQFKLLMIRTYASAFRAYSDQTIEFVSERTNPNNADQVEVQSLIKQSGRAPIPVNYRVMKEADGWKVFDINIDGISITSSFRNQFGDMVAQKGLDAVIADMKVRNQREFK